MENFALISQNLIIKETPYNVVFQKDIKGHFKPLAINDNESVNIENKRIVSKWFDIKKNVLPYGNIYFNKRIYKTASGFQRAFIDKFYKVN